MTKEELLNEFLRQLEKYSFKSFAELLSTNTLEEVISKKLDIDARATVLTVLNDRISKFVDACKTTSTIVAANGAAAAASSGKVVGVNSYTSPKKLFHGAAEVADLFSLPLDLFSENDRQEILAAAIQRGEIEAKAQSDSNVSLSRPRELSAYREKSIVGTGDNLVKMSKFISNIGEFVKLFSLTRKQLSETNRERLVQLMMNKLLLGVNGAERDTDEFIEMFSSLSLEQFPENDRQQILDVAINAVSSSKLITGTDQLKKLFSLPPDRFKSDYRTSILKTLKAKVFAGDLIKNMSELKDLFSLSDELLTLDNRKYILDSVVPQERSRASTKLLICCIEDLRWLISCAGMSEKNSKKVLDQTIDRILLGDIAILNVDELKWFFSLKSEKITEVKKNEILNEAIPKILSGGIAIRNVDELRWLFSLEMSEVQKNDVLNKAIPEISTIKITVRNLDELVWLSERQDKLGQRWQDILNIMTNSIPLLCRGECKNPNQAMDILSTLCIKITELKDGGELTHDSWSLDILVIKQKVIHLLTVTEIGKLDKDNTEKAKKILNIHRDNGFHFWKKPTSASHLNLESHLDYWNKNLRVELARR